MAQFRGGGRGPTQRQLRVGEELRHALADVLRRGDFRDPDLQKLNVTVTEVRISPDLRNATAFITPLGGGDAKEAVKVLRRAAAFFRAQIAKAVNLRYAPSLFFEADTSFDYASHIANILHSPDVARDLTPRDPTEDLDDDEVDDRENPDWREEENGAEYEDDDLDEDDEDEDDGVEYEDDDVDEDLDDPDVEYEDEDEDEDDVTPAKGGNGRRGA